MKAAVLVCVLKHKSDLTLLLREHWYRIPALHAPTKKFSYLAFYEPARFGRQGKRIRYYARILGHELYPRKILLPQETNHPHAHTPYYRIRLGKIMRLPRPIVNALPRRVSFGFTTMRRLKTARSILDLYAIPDTETIIQRELARNKIKYKAQHHLTLDAKRYCLDFAIFCKQGPIAIECDNLKAHDIKSQRKKDALKTRHLRRRGWIVIRLREPEIMAHPGACVLKIKKAVHKLGGQ